jgi:hypothetical protein
MAASITRGAFVDYVEHDLADQGSLYDEDSSYGSVFVALRGKVLSRERETTPLEAMNDKKVWTTDEIKQMLATRPTAVSRGIVAIWKLQTNSEQNAGHTHESNGVGYSGAHAEFMTSLADWINKGKTLTPKQLASGRRIILRYAGQLTKIANGDLQV